MSLTSYRAAPSRAGCDPRGIAGSVAGGREGVDIRLERYGVLARFGGDLLSHALRRSTIGATVLNCRVRDGTGCFTCAMTTKPSKHTVRPGGAPARAPRRGACSGGLRHEGSGVSHRTPSPRGGVFPGQVRCCMRMLLIYPERSMASTGSNQAYRTISTGQLNALLRLHLRPIDVVVYHGPQGYLVLKGASRLDAFSGYPVRS